MNYKYKDIAATIAYLKSKWTIDDKTDVEVGVVAEDIQGGVVGDVMSFTVKRKVRDESLYASGENLLLTDREFVVTVEIFPTHDNRPPRITSNSVENLKKSQGDR